MTYTEFGPYEKFKVPQQKSYTYKYPWDKIVQSGQQYGFFVAVTKKPKPPVSLKFRAWGILPAQHEGQRGWYVYVKSFTNGFKPEE